MGFKVIEIKRYGADGELKLTEKLTLRKTKEGELDRAYAISLAKLREVPIRESVTIEAGSKYERRGFLFRGFL